MKVLDLGCGKRKRAGAIGIDISEDTDADIVHDLNQFPYPFVDHEFDYIYADNIIEHLDNVVGILEELHRITKDGATIKIIVPFFRSVYAFIDPTHKHFFTVRSFDYFDPEKEFIKYYKYSKCHFRIEKVVFDEEIKHRFLGKIITWLANRNKLFYESRLSIICPLNTLTYYLRTIKNATKG
jgi:predicted SAM-dependent methyltransferase